MIYDSLSAYPKVTYNKRIICRVITSICELVETHFSPYLFETDNMNLIILWLQQTNSTLHSEHFAPI